MKATSAGIATIILAFTAPTPPLSQTPTPASAAMPFDQDAPLASRLSELSSLQVERYSTRDQPKITTHHLTPQQRAEVEAALASLPPMLADTAKAHVATIHFVDNMNVRARVARSRPCFECREILIRADVLGLTVSELATQRFREIFEPAPLTDTFFVRAGDTSALEYILRHELAHIWADIAFSGPATETSDPRHDVWRPDHESSPFLHQRPVLAGATELDAEPLAADRVAQLVEELSETPFVSLYAATNAQEDIAELIAWWLHAGIERRPYAIEFSDASGHLHVVEPMNFRLVLPRLRNLPVS